MTEAAASSPDEVGLRAEQRLKAPETKHFEFNNPGVDLHLKFRGRKNHVGLHCCCGLMSIGAILFRNFPNA
ncbi:hypothetical protein ACHAW6_009621 [Cyclotella cf. meneghiniana]